MSDTTRYEPEHVNAEPKDEHGYSPEDDGTMPENVAEFANLVVGKRIVKAERRKVKPSEFEATDGHGGYWLRHGGDGFVVTLSDGTRVLLADSSDCCAFTDLESFLLHADRIDHMITGVRTEDGYTKWHIFADFGDVLEMEVGWSCGNPFYYGYGFDIAVSNVIDADPVLAEIEQ